MVDAFGNWSKYMPMEFPKSIFVTGTDTSIGKTLVSAVLALGLGAAYWKPIQSGLEDISDTQWVQEKTGLPESFFLRETYRLERPLSPHASAYSEGIRIDLDAFHMPDLGSSRRLIIEGAGGIMVPLNERHFVLDLMKKLKAPVLLVASSELGTINHTLLSLEQLRRHHLDVIGVVMNGPKNPGNRQAIEDYGRVMVCAEIEPLPNIDRETLSSVFLESFM
jgi:dethiobiotin synthase